MPRTTTVTVAADGTPAVRHEAPAGPAADGLRHEAAVLRLAAGLRVVQVVESHDRPDGGAVLVTRYVAGGTLDQVTRAHGEAAAVAVLAQVAATLADLAERGISHRRCTADHVLGGPGDVALCGFSGARAVPDGTVVDTGPDETAFSALVQATMASDDEVARDARRAVGRLGTPGGGGLRAVAADLAAVAATHHPGDPAEAAGTVRVVAPRHPSATVPARRRPRARRAAVAAAVGVLAAAALAASVLVARDGDPPGAAPRRDAAAPVDTGVPAPARPATPPSTTVRRPPPDVPPLPELVWPAPPPVTASTAATPAATEVHHDGARYQVGVAGDLVAVGDWDCDGVATAAVVRPADGSVWAFPGWAGAGEVLSARVVGHVPSPVSVAVVADAGGCDAVSVTTGDGDEVVVRPG